LPQFDCELFRLGRDDFEEACVRYPEFEQAAFVSARTRQMLDNRRMSVEDAAYERKKEKKERGRSRSARSTRSARRGAGEDGKAEVAGGGLGGLDESEEMQGRTRKMSQEENRKLSGLKKMASVRAFVSMGKAAAGRKGSGGGGRTGGGVENGGGVRTGGGVENGGVETGGGLKTTAGSEWGGNEVAVGQEEGASWARVLQQDRRQSGPLPAPLAPLTPLAPLESRRKSGPFSLSPTRPKHFDITAPESPTGGVEVGGEPSSTDLHEMRAVKAQVTRVETRIGAIEGQLGEVKAQMGEMLALLRAAAPTEAS
jgi:hypothetical protein